MSTVVWVILGVLSVPAVLLCWVAWQFSKADGPTEENESQADADARMTSVRGALREDIAGAQLVKRRHIRAGGVQE